MKNRFKIFKINSSEYILTNKEGEITKLKGNQIKGIIEILKLYQQTNDYYLTREYFLENSLYDNEFINMVFSWLKTNNFIKEEVDNSEKNIALIGEFNEQDNQIKQIQTSLSESIKIKNIIQLDQIEASNVDLSIDLIVLIGPFWYYETSIKKVVQVMKETKKDFLYIELHRNGISIGPLMNLDLGTLCLNCLYKRKLANIIKPDVIVENMFLDEIVEENTINVFEIGNFNINKSFIINEIERIILKNQKSLYNKSIFIDFENYNNEFFKVLSVSDCGFCKNDKVYNPI